MKPITRLMVDTWEMNKIDWMGYQISRKNPFTYHHAFIPARKGGKATIDNGAILCGETSHPYIHVIENWDEERFEYLTEVLKEINEQRRMPSLEQFKKMRSCLESFEHEYSGKRTSKGKVLIKDTYTRRIM
jgi:hypothetical protein